MKTNFCHRKKSTLLILFILTIVLDVKAQFQAVGLTTDPQVNAEYGKLIATNTQITANAKLNKKALEGVSEVVFDELKALKTYNPVYVERGRRINRFVQRTSYDFIKEKYPILDPKGGNTEFLKNSLIRARFKFKLESELKKAKSYLATDNYISEGDRILLLVSSLEKVIKISIEDEDY